MYITLLLLATTTQMIVLFLLWKWPSYNWGSLLDRFVTSPAMAGLFAVLAAVIGAWSLNRQLTHTKQKAADEAWWEQFEWVTDRIVSPDGDETESAAKAKDRLPKSLAYNLMTALSKSAQANFQKAAVAGIFGHYLRDAAPSEQDGSATSDEPRMDATEAESLRALLAVVPDDSTSSETAHRLLNAYDRYREFEDEVQKALHHQFGDDHSVPSSGAFGADAVLKSGPHTLIIEVKQSTPSRSGLLKTINRLRSVVTSEDANVGIIITPPQKLSLGASEVGQLRKDRIHLIQWDPSELSGALKGKIQEVIA
mgnify:CR=1 FL=1